MSYQSKAERLSCIGNTYILVYDVAGNKYGSVVYELCRCSILHVNLLGGYLPLWMMAGTNAFNIFCSEISLTEFQCHTLKRQD